jgi:hypothetical protein
VLTGLIFCGFESVKNIQINLFCSTGKGVKMKQKYTIIKDSKNKQLIVREFAELDKEILSLLCEETYEQKVILAAIKKGKEDLISALRTNNLYPPGPNLLKSRLKSRTKKWMNCWRMILNPIMRMETRLKSWAPP